eukprot:315224-Pleurochrysis_carterae.AAC.1
MDGNKNKCPRCALIQCFATGMHHMLTAVRNTPLVSDKQLSKLSMVWLFYACSFARPPKCIDKELTNAMKLHVTGVIIHGNPDVVN